MKIDSVNVIKNHKAAGGFIKTSDAPLSNLSSEQKVLLNRKGNNLYNDGDMLAAQRLFITTGYSDGLARIGDVYKKKGEDLTALRFYHLAHNRAKSEPIIEKLAAVVSHLLSEDE